MKNLYTIIHISQTFLPGGGGLENSINCVINGGLDNGYEKQELICISNASLQAAEKKFDKSYPIRIFRTDNIFFAACKKLLKNFNSIVSGNEELTIIGRVSMIIFGIVSSYSLLVLLIRRVIGKKKIILHCYSLSALIVALFVRAIFFRKNIGIIMGIHFIYKKSGFFLFDVIIASCMKKANRFICVSNAAKKGIINAYDINTDIISVCYNWLTIDDLSGIKIIEGVKKKKKQIQILVVARIVPEKGIQEIINLGKYIFEKNLMNNFHITVIGDSMHPIKKTLEAACINNPSISYLGRINMPQLWKYYEQSHVFLMLSTWEEAFGRTIIESYAAGLPVVGSNKGGIPEVLENFSCFEIINNCNPDEILIAVENLVKKVDASGRDDFVVQSRMVIDGSFSERNFNDYDDAYQKLINNFIN